jgi:hypothetical protein
MPIVTLLTRSDPLRVCRFMPELPFALLSGDHVSVKRLLSWLEV